LSKSKTRWYFGDRLVNIVKDEYSDRDTWILRVENGFYFYHRIIRCVIFEGEFSIKGKNIFCIRGNLEKITSERDLKRLVQGDPLYKILDLS
jgi:hypothetical protein